MKWQGSKSDVRARLGSASSFAISILVAPDAHFEGAKGE